jgi:hypothetical protein
LVAFAAQWGKRRVSTEELKVLPSFRYYLDESDPDIVILRRQDDSFVAAFSTRGATKEGILEAAKQDYCELLQIHRTRRGEATEMNRSA